MIYKLSVMLAILNRGVTADYKVKCDDVFNEGPYTPNEGGTCEEICTCGVDETYTDMECKFVPGGADTDPAATMECKFKPGVGCGCVPDVKTTEVMTTEPPTSEAPTKMSTEPPTTEAPTKMSTEPPTSGAPAKASTKAPTDAPTKAPTTTTTTTTAAPTTTTTTTTASPGLALPWPKYPGRNCYWKNHGAEEVDYPWGKAVANVKTLHACQAACVEAADFGCHGVLFQVATGNCYRKKDIVVEKCVRDESVDLYVRPSATVFVDRLE